MCVATAAVGIGRVMGNKGAVGVRVTVDDDERENKRDVGKDEDNNPDGTSFTFVTAHLAAHQSQVERRAEDWSAIVQRLVFAPFGPSPAFVPHRRRNIFKTLERYNPKAMGGPVLQIYDTSYLFVFGVSFGHSLGPRPSRPVSADVLTHTNNGQDLNYRVDWPKEKASEIVAQISFDLPSLLRLDQLGRERAAGRTLHHLNEGEIAFPPTYKFKVGTDTYKANKRIPSWCDRVLYATWADGGENAKAEVELYRSAHKFRGSDHKPVYHRSSARISMSTTNQLRNLLNLAGDCDRRAPVASIQLARAAAAALGPVRGGRPVAPEAADRVGLGQGCWSNLVPVHAARIRKGRKVRNRLFSHVGFGAAG